MDNKFKSLSPGDVILYRTLYKKSLYEFVKEFWSCCDPSKLIDGKLIQFYCEVFQYTVRDWIGYKDPKPVIPPAYKNWKVVDVRQDKQNLCFTVPPRHSKTMIFSVLGPVWLWLSYPIKAASVSHTFGLSKDINSKRQKLIKSEKFQFFFNKEFKLLSTAVDQIKDDRGGELYAKNRDAMTGFGCDLALADDITNAEQARKDKQEMANCWEFFRNTLPSRINDINKGVIINIQQRLAINDVAGHIMNDANLASTYCFVSLPAIFEEPTILICPISGQIFAFNKGDALWPERFGDYQSLRYQVGENVFQAQYQQKPQNSDKNIIKPEMIVEKTPLDIPPISQAQMIFASHDFPVKDKESSDFLGSILAYRVGSTVYICDCLEKRMAFVSSIKYVKDLDNAYPGCVQIIEDKANGSPIIQQLQDEVPGVQAFQPGTQSKTQRLESASVYMSSGNVVFVQTQYNEMTHTYGLTENMHNLISRLLSFPYVEHDDIVDAFSQLVLFVFMDRRYSVYGRSFSDSNMTDYVPEENEDSTVFFNKEGDIWKAVEIVVKYGFPMQMIVVRETRFKANPEDGLKLLRGFAPKKNVFIDCSLMDAFYGQSTGDVYVEKYSGGDFEQSVNNFNLCLGTKRVTINHSCKGTIADIENFKYNKTKDESAVFKTESDGFVACLRIACKYFSI